jgi:hypothetical protein
MLSWDFAAGEAEFGGPQSESLRFRFNESLAPSMMMMMMMMMWKVREQIGTHGRDQWNDESRPRQQRNGDGRLRSGGGGGVHAGGVERAVVARVESGWWSGKGCEVPIITQQLPQPSNAWSHLSMGAVRPVPTYFE